MKKDKLLMVIVAISSVLLAIWAFSQPSYGMAIALIFNALICVYVTFYQLDK